MNIPSISRPRYVTVAAPLDSVPLFVLAGSVVPVLDPRVHTLNNATNTSVVTWASVKVGHRSNQSVGIATGLSSPGPASA